MLLNTLPTSIPEIIDYISTSGGKHSARNRLLYRMRPYWTTSELATIKIGEVLNADGTIRTHYENDGVRIEFSTEFQREITSYLCWRFNIQPTCLDKLKPYLWSNLFVSQKGSRLPGTTSARAFSPDGNTLRQFFSTTDRRLREVFSNSSQHQPA